MCEANNPFISLCFAGWQAAGGGKHKALETAARERSLLRHESVSQIGMPKMIQPHVSIVGSFSLVV